MSTDKPLSDINFFICSTYVDMRAYRDGVIKKIGSHAGVIKAQEFFGARDQKPLATCLEEVDKSDVFVMFLGPRYGSIDPDTNRSFVQREYERARERGMPRFAYFLDEAHPFPVLHVSKGEDAEKLSRFKAIVRAELTIDYFTTPDDLAEKVYVDLVRELPKKGFKLGQGEAEERSSASEVLSQFLALPKLFHGRTVRIRAMLGHYRRAEADKCQAFSYRYGATIARKFEPLDKDVKDSIGGSLTDIYAEEDAALALISVPANTEVDAVVKTLQGTYSADSPIYGYENDPYGLGGILNLDPRRRVVVAYHTESTLICGLEMVELRQLAG